MSVRRLAPKEVQPESFAFTADNLDWAGKTIAKYPPGRQASAVIPLLFRAQEQCGGWLPEPAMRVVGDMLGMAPIRVYEIATFYTQFMLQPVGRKAHIQVCGTTPCMLRGAEDLVKVCKSRIHHEPFHLSADGDFSWEEVECAGACVNAPMVQVYKDVYEDLTPEILEKILDGFARGETPTPGPQRGRQGAEPANGLTSLTDPAIFARVANDDVASAAPAPAVPEPPVEAARPTTAVATPPDPTGAVSAAAEKAMDGKSTVEKREESGGAPATEALPVVSDESKPVLLTAAEAGKADDLEKIWGVGPKLAQLLHELGVFHFSQIAGWSEANLAWIDQHLGAFRGRAVRERWIAQAKALAEGGSAADAEKIAKGG